MENNFVKLASIDVGSKIEKKNGLSYLSWAWAVDQLLRQDPSAAWEYGTPVAYGDTLMVSCTVNAFGTPRTAHLPVMDHRNKAITNPDAFAVNTAMQRCLVKAIALHGLGLYIYAGEDIPSGQEPVPHPEPEDVYAASPNKREAAEAAAKMGMYHEFWQQQTPAFRAAAIQSPFHREYKDLNEEVRKVQK